MTDLPAERVWKAATTIQFPAAAYAEGLAFSEDDILAIAATFTENVARGSQIAKFISPQRSRVLGPEFYGKSEPGAITAWVLVECYASNVRPTILRLMRQNPEMFPKSWFGPSRVPIFALSVMLKHDKDNCALKG